MPTTSTMPNAHSARGQDGGTPAIAALARRFGANINRRMETMIETLITGKLYGAPKLGTTKNGGSYANAKVKIPAGDGDTLFASIITFSDTAVQALCALTDGDPVACVGTLKVSTYVSKNGDTRVSLDITATQVMTLYQVKRKRAAVQDDDVTQHPQPRPPRRHAPPAGHGSAASGRAFDQWQAAQLPADDFADMGDVL
jgi:single-stranded DNA-binding protein